MTPADLDAALVLRRARLAESAAQQVVELRAKQRSGEQRVGPWAPAATISQPKRTRKRAALPFPARKRA